MHLDESIDEVMTPEAKYDEYKLFLQKKKGRGSAISNPSTRVQALVAASCILIISCLL